MSRKKILTICIIGKPNAGKSSLLNCIVGQKLSIVTPKVQTTRTMITGITTINDVQLIMYDTPGIFEPKQKLEKAMVRCAWSSLHSADVVVLIIDQTQKINSDIEIIIERLHSLGVDPIFVYNKIDLVRDSVNIDDYQPYIAKFFPNAVTFHISALRGKGVNELTQYFLGKAYDSEWLYPEDDLTDLPMRFLAAEITREQLFLHLSQELPYNLTVQTDEWKEEEQVVTVRQIIVVTRENHKKIILGKAGQKIKSIGIKSRLGIEEMCGKKVNLLLFVKVREEWQSSSEYYHSMRLKLESKFKR